MKSILFTILISINLLYGNESKEILGNEQMITLSSLSLFMFVVLIVAIYDYFNKKRKHV